MKKSTLKKRGAQLQHRFRRSDKAVIIERTQTLVAAIEAALPEGFVVLPRTNHCEIALVDEPGRRLRTRATVEWDYDYVFDRSTGERVSPCKGVRLKADGAWAGRWSAVDSINRLYGYDFVEQRVPSLAKLVAAATKHVRKCTDIEVGQHERARGHKAQLADYQQLLAEGGFEAKECHNGYTVRLTNHLEPRIEITESGNASLTITLRATKADVVAQLTRLGTLAAVEPEE